jgi:hypothetical protein
MRDTQETPIAICYLPAVERFSLTTQIHILIILIALPLPQMKSTSTHNRIQRWFCLLLKKTRFRYLIHKDIAQRIR